MKKLFTVVAILAAMFVAGNVQAQMSVNVGYAPEVITTNNNSANYQGFFANLVYNINLAKNFGVAVGPQVRFNTKSESNEILSVKTIMTHNQFLVDVPIMFNYRINLTRDINIAPFIGPMLTYAISGNTKTTVDSPLGATTNTTNWYGDNSDYSRFNLNGVGGLALNYQNFKLFGGYSLGLLDLYKSDNVTIKTNSVFVGLGFAF